MSCFQNSNEFCKAVVSLKAHCTVAFEAYPPDQDSPEVSTENTDLVSMLPLKFDTCSIIFHSLFTKKTCGINMLANVDP